VQVSAGTFCAFHYSVKSALQHRAGVQVMCMLVQYEDNTGLEYMYVQVSTASGIQNITGESWRTGNVHSSKYNMQNSRLQ
jgi:hypothetical protein